MPLTAFSTSQPGERDVDQVLARASAHFGQPYSSVEAIPEAWRAFLRTDLQCPGCFATGAEVVRGSVISKTGKSKRQSFFRFTTPGHNPYCEFDSDETANLTPENLVSFGESRSNLTRVVRDLVCTGIDQGVFSQVTIRDMREWFYKKRVSSLFEVTLDPRWFPWIEGLRRAKHAATGSLPDGVLLTQDIASLPEFDWRAEAARRVLDQHPEIKGILEIVDGQRLWFSGESASQLESLVRRSRGRMVFDPNSLRIEYGKTVALAHFIARNHAPLKAEKARSLASVSVLAFSALLLFVSGWDTTKAITSFIKIVSALGHANPELGNVMGLNPFHNYETWNTMKRIQDLQLEVPDNSDIKAERVAMEVALRAQFGAPPMPA